MMIIEARSRLNVLNKHKFLSNYHASKFWFNDKEYNSVDELYKDYKTNPGNFKSYKNLEVVMLFGIFHKFLQNNELRNKITGIEEIQGSSELLKRLGYVQSILKELQT